MAEGRSPIKFCVATIAGCLLGIFLLGCMACWAGEKGSITGTLVDPSGAMIPGASVIISNPETGLRQIVATNSEGFFSCPELEPGTYQVEVHMSGFGPLVESEVRVNTSQVLALNLKLELGQQATTVTVSESNLHVETADTATGDTITAAKISAIPLNGRSFTDLLALQPGVVPASSRQPNAVVMSGCTSTSPSGDLNPGNLSISGQRETSNGFILNGSDVEEDFNMGAALIPNLDSIEDFRVLTGNFDAQYGNYSGGQVVVTTKAGTNDLHGSGFDFLRNTNLDARNYFSADRARYDQNQFGAHFRRPHQKRPVVFLCGLSRYANHPGHRDRFDFRSLARRARGRSARDRRLAYWQRKWPIVGQSPLAKFGLPRVGGRTLLLSRVRERRAMRLAQRADSTQRLVRPGQSSAAAIPLPNQGANIFSTSGFDETLRDDKVAARIDTHRGRESLALYYFFDDYALDNPYPTAQGGANVPGFNAITLGRSQLASLGLTTVLSTTTVNEFHLSYLRDANNVGQPQGGVGPSLASQGFVDSAGNPSIYALEPKIEGIENVSFNDFTFGVDTTGLNEANNTFQSSDNFSKVMGTHIFKVGAGFHLDQVNINPDATFNGAFSFTGAETGSDFADFLLGIPSSYAQGDSLAFYLAQPVRGNLCTGQLADAAEFDT